MKPFSKISQASKSQGLQQSVILSFGNGIAAAISAVALILTSRYLGPEDFGIFSACLALLFLTVKLFDFGINVALQRTIAQDNRRAYLQGQAILYLKLTLSIAAIIIAIFLSNYIATQWLHIQDANLVKFSLALVGITYLYEFLASFVSGLHRFNVVIAANTMQAITKLTLTLIAVLTASLSTLVAILFFATAPLVSIVYFLNKTSLIQIKRSVSIKNDIHTILKVAKFTGIGVLSAAAAEHLDVLLVQHFLTSTDTGLYSAAGKISLYVNFFATSFLVVLSVRVAKYKSKQDISVYISKAILFSAAAFFAVLLLIPFSKYLLTFTSGASYIAATQSLQLLLVSSGLVMAATPFIALFYLFKKPQFYSYFGVLLLLSLISFDLIFIPRLGIAGASLAQLLTRLILLIFTIVYAKIQYHRHQFSDQ